MHKAPNLEFIRYPIYEFFELYKNGRILINKEYQRSFIWKRAQKSSLINTILKGYSMGVLVIWENSNSQLEILDGQQRIRTIMQYLEGGDIQDVNGRKFHELYKLEQTEFLAYDIYCIKLLSSFSEEQISDIFTRLQEGTPLNTPEKVNAFRGRFRDTFMSLYQSNPKFFSRTKNYRFKARFLAAQFLLIELKSNFEKKKFPDMGYADFKAVNQEFKDALPEEKVTRCHRNIDFLGTNLSNEIDVIPFRDLISLYLLITYLYRKRTFKEGFGLKFRKFALEFTKNLTSFSIYDTSPPNGMDKKTFERLMLYKQYGRQATKAESLKLRLDIIFAEFNNFEIKDNIDLLLHNA